MSDEWAERSDGQEDIPARVVLAWLDDRRHQYDESSGIYSAIAELMQEVRDGEVARRWSEGELDDLLPEELWR